MERPLNPPSPDGAGAGDVEEIYVDITEDGLVRIQATTWHLDLDPDEARALAKELSEAADEAESEG